MYQGKRPLLEALAKPEPGRPAAWLTRGFRGARKRASTVQHCALQKGLREFVAADIA